MTIEYLMDAARMLESAARNLKKAADSNEHLFNRKDAIGQAKHKINAALARIASFPVDVEAETKVDVEAETTVEKVEKAEQRLKKIQDRIRSTH